MITPLEISHKEFNRALRGYSPKEVDEFLERVATHVEGLVNEKAALVSEIESLKENLSRYHTIEDTLQNTLLMAQRTAEETLNNARKQAELMEEEARRRGVAVEDEAKKRVQGQRDELDAIRARQRTFVRQFKAILESFLEEIERYGASGRDDGEN